LQSIQLIPAHILSQVGDIILTLDDFPSLEPLGMRLLSGEGRKRVQDPLMTKHYLALESQIREA
jgi:hypothetical protein